MFKAVSWVWLKSKKNYCKSQKNLKNQNSQKTEQRFETEYHGAEALMPNSYSSARKIHGSLNQEQLHENGSAEFYNI